jgi:hypothetical protein
MSASLFLLDWFVANAAPQLMPRTGLLLQRQTTIVIGTPYFSTVIKRFRQTDADPLFAISATTELSVLAAFPTTSYENV